jgi:hypothetical protein
LIKVFSVMDQTNSTCFPINFLFIKINMQRMKKIIREKEQETNVSTVNFEFAI